MKTTHREIAVGDTIVKGAHDLRSPLAALALLVERLNQNEQIPQHEKWLLKSLILRIRAVSRDILGHSRGSFIPELEAGSTLEDLISPVLAEKTFLISEERTGVEFFLDACAKDLGTKLYVDANGFQRMLSTLLDNAIEARPRSIRLMIESDDDKIKIQILDNGKGIPATLLPQLGKVAVSTTKPNGVGVGVLNARKFIESSGGKLRIESTVNVGTLVSVWL